MSLTQQPFAHVPALDQLGQELFKNVPDHERTLSGALGVGLVLAGMKAHGPLRWLLCAAGGALARRAVTGHCSLYEHLGVKRRQEH